MGKRILILLTRQLSPVFRLALVAGLGACGILVINLSLWSAMANWSTLWSLVVLLPISLVSILGVGGMTAFVAWKELSRDGGELERLETNVQCFEAELDERQRAARAHAAIARLMEAAVRHLAAGEVSSRIRLELPEPYRAFRDHFNTVASRLEAQQKVLEANAATAGAIEDHAQEIGDAATQLIRRAEKLAERLVTDLEAIETGAERHPSEALELAQFTMGGVKIATARNIEAATHLAKLGQIVAEYAQELAMPVAPELGATDAEQLSEPDADQHAAEYPASIGTSALKLLAN